jgi:GNAT superfamily N-acetyltransferase
MKDYYCRAAQVQDWTEINQIELGAFKSNSEYSGLYRRYHDTLEPNYENIRVIVERDTDTNKERVVGVCPILDRQVHYGNHTLKFGGLFDVATHPDYQGKGIGGLLQKHVADFLIKNGYEIGYLSTGKWGFYAKTGWQNTLMTFCYRLPVKAPDHLELHITQLKESDWNQVIELYETFNKIHPITFVRSVQSFRALASHNPGKLEHVYVLRQGSEFIGYFWAIIRRENEKTVIKITEYATNKARMEKAILESILSVALSLNGDYVDILLSDEFPLVQYARTTGVENLCGFVSGLMVWANNWQTSLPKIVDYMNQFHIPKISPTARMKLPSKSLLLTIANHYHLQVDINVEKIGLQFIPNIAHIENNIQNVAIPHRIFLGIVFGNQLASDLAEEWAEEWPMEDEAILKILDTIFHPIKGIFYETDHF